MAPYESVAQRVPYAIALVQLPEGPTVMSNIIGCDLDKIHIGQEVTLTFEQRGEVKIPQFRPAR